MKKKIFLTFLLITLFIITVCSYSFAKTNIGNDLMNAGRSVGNAVGDAAGAVVNGAKDLTNGASNMMNDVTNANGNTENDATNTLATNDGILDMGYGDYTATRTATNNNGLLGMSDTTWTWIILGIVGISIIALVWYYGAQYEHRNYSND